jgi:penicillin-binding protein 2
VRDRAIASIISVFFILLVIGLLYNQVLRYGYYARLSKNNSIRIIPIVGPRGNIYDRNGNVLVTNRLSFNVAMISNELRDRRKVARILNEVLGISGEEIIAAFDKAEARPYAPMVIVEDVPKDKAISLEEEGVDVDGLIIETVSKRDYVHKASGSHVYGYLSEISEDELDRLREYGYRPRDLVGRDGIEKYYDAFLRGSDGGTQVEVDSRGRQIRVLGVKEPESGIDLYLSIDASLQNACDKLLGDRRGAVVVMDPQNGEILALASHPAFDPNIFIRPNASAERLALLADRAGRPLSNKAISGLYPPGSVFKVVTASGALETKKINRSTSFTCNGSYRLGRTTFDCWKAEGHGVQDVVSGMMNSCNVFFYNTGRILGADDLEAYTKLFGFGRPTDIDLPDEVKGIVPGRAWKRSHRKEEWFEGETLNYAIGQGYLLVTPMQVLGMIAVMANKGSIVRPHIVKRVGPKELPQFKKKDLGLKASTVKVVRDGLYEAINGESGTGKRAKADGVTVAGKTGTAQTPRGRTHAWFCGFAPFEDAKLCVVILIEHGGHGGVVPAEIARGIFEEAKRLGYYDRR